MKNNYSPIFFLSALGPGGMAVAFYMYFMFMTPHKGVAMPTYDTLMAYFNKTTIYGKVGMGLVLFAVLFFAYKHIQLLIKNTIEYKKFKKTQAYKNMKGTLQEITLMAIPLTYAMAINVMFILGAILVPGLWDVVEYLFPGALLGFLIVGFFAFKIFLEYFVPIIINGNEEWEKNTNFSQLLSVFAFVMIGVGFAAPGAMSHIKVVNAIGLFFSFMFIGAAVGLMILKFVLGFHSVIKHGIAKKAAPTLWILIPILTLIGITFFRQRFGLAHNFADGHSSVNEFTFVLTGAIIAIETLIGLFGYFVMKELKYFDEYVHGDTKDPATYALICPGVAYTVFGFFFIHWGLVYNGVVTKFSIGYWVLVAILAFIQYKTVATMLKLNKKFGL
jgi:hypothetical protein